MTVRTAYVATESAGDVLTATNFNRLPGGWIGYVQVTASQTGITTETDLTGLSVAVTVNTNRRLRIVGFVGRLAQSAADTAFLLRIKEGATQLALTYGNASSTNGVTNGNVSCVLTPTSGSHTYKMSLESTTSTNIEPTATNPAYLLVEDIGPAT